MLDHHDALASGSLHRHQARALPGVRCRGRLDFYDTVVLGSLRSPGITRLRRYYGPIPHPLRPDLPLTGCRLRARPHRLGFPCSGRSPCPACHRPYPGGTAWTRSLVLSSQHRPSPLSGRVGSHVILFEACSAFTRVTACMRAESPSRPFDIGVFQRNSLPPLTAPTASGWSDPLPGGTLTHWRSPSLHGTPDSPILVAQG